MFLLRSIFHGNGKIRKLVLHMGGNYLNNNGENRNKNGILNIFFCGGAYLFILAL